MQRKPFRTVAAGLTKFEKAPASSAGVRKSVPGRRNCTHISLESGKNLASVVFTKGTSGTKAHLGGGVGGRTRGRRTDSYSL